MSTTAPHIFVDRTTTWHAIGKSVEECKDLEGVLAASGLDYEVSKAPVFGDIRTKNGSAFREPIPHRFVTYRPDEQGGYKTYDVVSDKFEVIQNCDAFNFVGCMGEELQFEKAGETANGMVYIIGKLPEVSILGDSFIPHVLFRNGFDGKTKITATICPLRLVCQNQFNFAFKNTRNTVTIRHVQNAQSKLEEACGILKLSANYMAELSSMAEHFAALKMTDAQLDRVVKFLFPIPEDSAINPFKRKTLMDARAAFKEAHEREDNRNFRGTAWGLINAYIDMLTHREPAGKREDRFEGKFVNTTFKISMNPIIQAIEAVAV